MEIPFLDATKGSLELLDEFQEGIWIADNSERIVFANRALARLIGEDDARALAGRLWRELLPAGEAARLARPRPGACPAAESTILTRDDRRIPVSITLSRRTASEGDWYVGSVLPAGVLKSRDMSPEPVRQTEPVRADSIAAVCHDLRTPLSAVKEALSLLSETEGGRLEERQRRYLTIAREEVDRSNRMINNLVEVSQLDSGRVVLRFDAVDLPELLSSAVESLSPLVNKRDLTVERNIPSCLPPVMGDRDRLLRVFSNILDNAVKYAPEGGTIRVDMGTVDTDAAVPVETGIRPNAGHVQVTVSDDGPGIPAESLERIFGRFERVDQHGPGIGLGLAIARSVVEMHRGRIWAESDPGKGARFHFILPIKENS